MKRIIILIWFLSMGTISAQVGIGTTSPQTDLHVNGDVLVQNGFKIGSLGVVDALEEDFMLLTRSTSSTPVGKITLLDVNARAVAPVNVIDYSFSNISLDNLSDVDLQYDSDKYIVAISNFRYSGDAITKLPVGGTTTYTVGNFVVRTFIAGGTWHLEVQNRTLDLDVLDSVSYDLTLIVYDKSFFRNMPTITSDLGGLNTGTASSVPNLY